MKRRSFFAILSTLGLPVVFHSQGFSEMRAFQNSICPVCQTPARQAPKVVGHSQDSIPATPIYDREPLMFRTKRPATINFAISDTPAAAKERETVDWFLEDCQKCHTVFKVSVL